MSNLRRRAVAPLAVPVALAALAGLASGCGSSSSANEPASAHARTAVPDVPYRGIDSQVPRGIPAPKPKALKIAIASPLEANDAVAARTKGVVQEVRKLGGSTTVYDAKVTPDTQVSQIEQAIASKVDAIVVEPVDPHALAPVLSKASAAHIPVVGIDVNLDSTDPGPGFATQIYTGRDRMAYAQAKLAASLLPKGASIGQIGFAVPIPQLRRMVAQEKTWATKFGLKPVGESDNPSDDIAGGEKAMTQLINQHPDIKGVIAYNDGSAVGAASAARAAGKRDLVLIGNNGGSLGIDSVRSGRIAGTVQVDDPDTSRFAAWAAYTLAEGGKVPKAIFAGPPTAVDKANAGHVRTWDQILAQRAGQ